MGKIFRVEEGFDHAYFAGSSCAFGVFDGVHEGHRYLIGLACEAAQARGGRSIALTFDRDPDEEFRPDTLKKLMTNEERLDMLSETGVDAVVALHFTREFAASSPDEFLLQTFDDTPPSSLHVGFDFRFGSHASGTVKELDTWGRRKGVDIHSVSLRAEDGAPVTATRIRGLLSRGKVREANKLLNREYFVTGIVEPGRGEGADMGFKTANLFVPEQLRTLGDGVYAAWATVGGERYRAAVSVGVAPTFADRAHATCEVHLLDYEGDLYGKPIKVEFVEWLRPMMEFPSVEELIDTVMGNIAWVRDNLVAEG